MSLASDKKKVLKSLQFYEDYLKTIKEETFQISPLSGGWSFSEVYSHILGANLMSSIAIEKCLNKTAEIKTRKPHWKVRLILFFGKFPPGKLKAPAEVEAAVKKITKEEASNLLIKFRKKLEIVIPEFRNYNSHYKMKHPRLGYLDAKSWLRFILIHSMHHEKQIGRIKKVLT